MVVSLSHGYFSCSLEQLYLIPVIVVYVGSTLFISMGIWGGGESKNPANGILCSVCQLHQLLSSILLQWCNEVSLCNKWKTVTVLYSQKLIAQNIEQCSLRISPVSSRNELACVSEAIQLRQITQYPLAPLQFPMQMYPQSATTELESPVWSIVIFVALNQTLHNRFLKT